MSFSNNLKRIRQKRKLSQQSLAEKLNIAQSTVGMWEAGRRTPKLDELERIARVLGVGVTDFIGTGKTISLEGLEKSEIKKIQDYVYAMMWKKYQSKKAV